MRLAGKTIVVSGSAHGIGRADSERLAADGANVAPLDISTAGAPMRCAAPSAPRAARRSRPRRTFATAQF
jgi:NAD(P)-dependent dehydrogenase (short-subunit alcohol dehydrogenase family)